VSTCCRGHRLPYRLLAPGTTRLPPTYPFNYDPISADGHHGQFQQSSSQLPEKSRRTRSSSKIRRPNYGCHVYRSPARKLSSASSSDYLDLAWLAACLLALRLLQHCSVLSDPCALFLFSVYATLTRATSSRALPLPWRLWLDPHVWPHAASLGVGRGGGASDVRCAIRANNFQNRRPGPVQGLLYDAHATPRPGSPRPSITNCGKSRNWAVCGWRIASIDLNAQAGPEHRDERPATPCLSRPGDATGNHLAWGRAFGSIAA